MKAIAYVRWSSDDQSAGNSLERQTANAQAYCMRNSFELVDTLIDDGYSAFKGHHISKGQFGEFLRAADKGKYRGYALVTEQMDRLSRQGIAETFRLTERILNAGLEIHMTQQNRVVRSLDDLPTVILQAVESHAAQEYSKKLRERVGSAWANKKHNGPNGVSITNKLPAWLDGKTGEKITANEQKAEVVRQMFEWSASGMGKRLIARRLNEQKAPTFGGGKRNTSKWIASYIHKILTNRAVLGEYQPRKNHKPDGDVRVDFFPRVVDPALFQKVQGALASRRTNTDRGSITGKFAGRTGKISNLFTGMVWDATNLDAKKRMYYIDKGKRSLPHLSTEKTGIERTNSFEYERFERWFLTWLDQLDMTAILDAAESEDLKHAEEVIASLALDIERAEQQVQKLTDLLLDTPSKALKERLLKTEAQIETHKADKVAAEKRLSELKRRHHDLLEKSVVYSKLAQSRDFETRARLREEIRRKVERIEFAFHTPVFGDNDTIAVVHFVNGKMIALVFCADGSVLTGDLDDPGSWLVISGK
jgi:DNA invertase Pin-like site-specific DNA recombinase